MIIKTIIISLVIWSFINPSLASIIFLIFAFLFEGFLILASILNKPDVNENDWTSEEIKIIKKYIHYFNFPYASRSFSSSVSLIVLATYILVPWLIYKQVFIQSAIIGLNFFIASPIQVKFNPLLFKKDKHAYNLKHSIISRKSLLLMREITVIEAVIGKILKKQRTNQHDNIPNQDLNQSG